MKIDNLNELPSGIILYTKTKRFFPDEGYYDFNPVRQATEIVTFDPLLCPALIDFDTNGFWEKCAYDNVSPLRLFEDFEYVKSFGLTEGEQIFALIPNPKPETLKADIPQGFEFCGYDVVEMGDAGFSSATDCGFSQTAEIDPSKMNKYGIFSTLKEARTFCDYINTELPEFEHGPVVVYEIWRLTGPLNEA